MATNDYSLAELLTVCVSRELEDGGQGFIGLGTGGRAFTMAVGVPSVAAELARRHRGIDFTTQYGVTFEPDLKKTPANFADPYLLAWPSKAQVRVEECLEYFRRGKMTVGFTSGAQIDRRGNLNTVCIGSHDKPKVRLVGPIAQSDHCTYAKYTFVMMVQDPRVFVPKLDFRSALGHGDAAGDRRRLGVPGGGPRKVFTDLAIWGFDADGDMRVETLHPGATREDVVRTVGFDVVFADDLGATPAPTPEELRLIREEIDPEGLFLEARIA
ncbi:glutaconate CoA-transferase subunit B [Faunimonas pinastri]|uniref:Glutaconate CoA-transferase subunit B n=1 Tax=Faunimonas pinastri TaxID=1855383 RepID=A0A1H9EM71_9HYPH|nr:CoA-transferase [Faunimonas pinastri]SEQ26108.1 glutaconate CoA-transferase subunit B [Faunimonas pinastri]